MKNTNQPTKKPRKRKEAQDIRITNYIKQRDATPIIDKEKGEKG